MAQGMKISADLQDSRAAPLVERVDRQTTAMTRMLEDLLDASRIAFGKVSLQIEAFDLRPLLIDALQEQAPHARNAGLQLITQIASCVVDGDRVAYDGPSAIKSALQSVPDVILCDLGLPGGMDGFALARACRAEESLRGVRLVAASGYSSAEDYAKSKTAGFDLLVVKPLTEKSLSALIR